MNPHAPILRNSPGDLPPITAYLSFRFTVMSKGRSNSAPSVMGKVCVPPLSCARAPLSQVGSLGSDPRGPSRRVAAVSGRGTRSLSASLTSAATLHSRPQAPSSFVLS